MREALEFGFDLLLLRNGLGALVYSRRRRSCRTFHLEIEAVGERSFSPLLDVACDFGLAVDEPLATVMP